MPEPSTRVAALLAGEVTIIQAIPTDLVEKLKKSNRVQLKTVEGTRSYQIELNNKKPPFDDVRVRQAVNMAVDWDKILKNIYLGYATRLPTCFLPVDSDTTQTSNPIRIILKRPGRCSRKPGTRPSKETSFHEACAHH